jgi:hypothetical protein
VFGPDENGSTHEDDAPDPRRWIESRIEGRVDVLRGTAPDRGLACDRYSATWVRLDGAHEVDERAWVDLLREADSRPRSSNALTNLELGSSPANNEFRPGLRSSSPRRAGVRPAAGAKRRAPARHKSSAGSASAASPVGLTLPERLGVGLALRRNGRRGIEPVQVTGVSFSRAEGLLRWRQAHKRAGRRRGHALRHFVVST